MNTHKMAALVGVVVAGLVVVGCSRGSIPGGPSPLPQVIGGEFELRGSVYDSGGAAGAPLEGVLATVSNDAVAFSTVTDSRGSFGFSGLSAGTWHVSLTKEGFSDETLDVEVNGDTSISCELRPSQPPTITRLPSRIR